MNLNKIFLLGRLTADPQLRTTPNGHQVATFSVATNRAWNDKIVGRREEVEFHNVVVWGQQADVASRFLARGSLVLIEGRVQTRTWEDQQGQKRKTTEIVSERLQLPPRSMNSAGRGGPPAAYPGPSAGFAAASGAALANSGQAASAPSPAPPPPPANVSELPTIEVGDMEEESPPVAALTEEEGEIKKEDLPF